MEFSIVQFLHFKLILKKRHGNYRRQQSCASTPPIAAGICLVARKSWLVRNISGIQKQSYVKEMKL